VYPASEPDPDVLPGKGGGWNENGELLSPNAPTPGLSNPDSPPGPYHPPGV
jgi:hypothetical protein